MNNILIFGANGMLGSYLCSFLKNYFTIIPITRKDFDLDNASSTEVYELFKINKLNKNDIIINCAGAIPQKISNKRKFYSINSIFPIILSNVCQKNECKLIHITTDCVFSGSKGNYDEYDIHDETNDYGLSKSLGELINATIIRTSIIGHEINHKSSLLEWVISNENKKINGFKNHYWNGVTCLELSKIIYRIILANNFWKGVRHIFSPNSLSKYELLKFINEIYKLKIDIIPLETSVSINRTLSTIYDEKICHDDIYTQLVDLYKYKNI
jgi:dTDP-4-dehydrorhamnose reductase